MLLQIPFNNLSQQYKALSSKRKKYHINHFEYVNESYRNILRFRLVESVDGISRDSLMNPLTPEQMDYFANSKVRDSKCNLIVCYHGTSTDFSTFDTERTGKGNDQYGSGFYFTTEESGALQYGNNVKAVYLNITNPLYMTEENEFERYKSYASTGV